MLRVMYCILGVLLLFTCGQVSTLPTPEDYSTYELPTTDSTDFLITTEQASSFKDAPEINEVSSGYDDNSPLDVNGTIEEVERILALNPNLPRLSRSEILEILDNLTMSEDDNIKEELIRIQNEDQSFPSEYKSREEYAKALMLVLPFNAKDMSESKIQELYTKAPITRLVDKPEDDDILIGYSPTETAIDKEVMDEHDYYPPQEITKPFQETSSISTTRPFYYPTPSKMTRPPTTKPITTEKLPARYTPPINKVTKPVRKPSKETISTKPDNVPDKSVLESNYQDIIDHSLPKPGNYQSTSYYVSEPPQDTLYVTQKPTNTPPTRHKVRRPVARPGAPQKSRRPSSTTTTTTATPSTTPPPPPTTPTPDDIQLGLPQDMKHLLVAFDVQDHMQPSTKEEPTFFMTPSPIVTEKIQYSSQYTVNQITSTTEKPAMSDNVQGVLASIGLYPEQMKTQATFNTPVKIVKISTTTTTQLPDLSQGAESLSPEMKELLISFGLLPSPDADSSIRDPPGSYQPLTQTQGVSPSIDPSSYQSFKPLPIATAPTGGDMQDFLASFGLVPSDDTGRGSPYGIRTQKAIQMSPSKDNMTKQKTALTLNTDMLTDDMKEILENLGLIPTSKSKKNPSMFEETNGKEHVFNPSQHFASLNPSEEEAKRLNKLLETIKKFAKENATLTPEQVEALDASFFSTTFSDTSETITTPLPKFVSKKTTTKIVPLDQIADAPDPLDELFQLYNTTKNEIKRQQPNATSTISESSTTTERTDERAPSLDALAESFGGGETATSDVDINEQLPPARPNGLYFFLDWNSFLEVGEENKNKVNIRIAPKVGDSRNFLEVRVP